MVCDFFVLFILYLKECVGEYKDCSFLFCNVYDLEVVIIIYCEF